MTGVQDELPHFQISNSWRIWDGFPAPDDSSIFDSILPFLAGLKVIDGQFFFRHHHQRLGRAGRRNGENLPLPLLNQGMEVGFKGTKETGAGLETTTKDTADIGT